MPEHLADRATSTDSDFRKLLDIAPAIIWMATPDGSCTYLSRSWTNVTGQNAEDGLRDGWLASIYPDDRAAVWNNFTLARYQHTAYQTEYRVKTAQGQFRWVLDSASPITSPSGALQGFIGSIVDNQLRKTAELARDQSEHRLQVALRASSIGIWQWDIETNQFEFSGRSREIFGFAEGPVTFDRLNSRMNPADLLEVRRLSADALDPSLRSRETYRYRITRESDGEIRWIEAHGEAQFLAKDDQERAVTYIGTFQDITAAVEQEIKLKEESARLALALDAAQLAVWELDILNDRVAPSPMLNTLYGFAPEAEPTANDLRSRYAPGERERLEHLGREALKRGEDRIRAEVKHIMPDGSVKWLLIQAQTASPTREGGPRAIGVVMDVTERRLHEEKLAVAAREMQHRIKNSLALVQSLVQQSFRADRSIDEGRKVFGSRLQAYAGVTDLLLSDGQGAANIVELLNQALSPFWDGNNGRFAMDGPPVLLPEGTAFGVGLAAHELATNATKYGALSVPEGKVKLNWGVEFGALHLTWQEMGGPVVKEAPHRGFGTKLLQGALLQGGQGSVELSFPPGGVCFKALLPLT